MRLIDADALKKWADDSVTQYGNQYSTDMLNMFGLFKEVIDNAPTVPQVTVFSENASKEEIGFFEKHLEYVLNRQQGKWIPIKTRPMTEEEIEQFKKEFPIFSEEDFWAYDCPLPQDNEEVLITTGFSHNVVVTTFCVDEGCWFENYEDKGDVIAWMPLPKPYKGGET